MRMTRVCFLNSLEICYTFNIALFGYTEKKKKNNEQIVTPGSVVYIILVSFQQKMCL